MAGHQMRLDCTSGACPLADRSVIKALDLALVCHPDLAKELVGGWFGASCCAACCLAAEPDCVHACVKTHMGRDAVALSKGAECGLCAGPTGSLIDCIVQDASQALSLRACILASPFWEVLPAGRPQGAELALLWQLSHSTLWCPSYGSCCMCGAYELVSRRFGILAFFLYSICGSGCPVARPTS